MHHWFERRIPGAARFGRRTLILLHGGGAWLIFGWAIYTIPVHRFSGPSEVGLVLSWLDSPLTGLLWLAGGGLAIVNAPLRKRWGGRDVIGFVGLTVPPIVWFLAYLWSAIVYLVPGGAVGTDRSVVGLVNWYLVSAFVLVVAGWPDPDDPTIEASIRRGDGTVR